MTTAAAPPLAAMLPYLVALLALAAIALMILGIRHAREAKTHDSAGGALLEPVVAAPGPSRRLPQSIKLASWQLQRLVAGGAGGGIYDVPWVVAVGAGGADLDRLLPDRLPWPPDLSSAHQAILSQVGHLSLCRAGAVIGFDDALLDGAQWQHRWHALIRALETCRPERPIDGLVIVLRVDELPDLPNGHDRLVSRGDQLYQLVWSVQRLTGWRIPVYLLIRGCEELDGFADWVLALPRDARRQIVGWSSPYAVDSAFEPRWVDDGVAEMVRQLSTAQLLLMMPEPELSVSEGLLLFPGEAQRLSAPLSVLLTGMLRPSAYHEAFMFRGFFLAGSIPGAAAAGAREEAFAEALFTQKIFPEHQLVQPAYGETTRRHRQIRIAQTALAAIAVLCVFGILYIQRVKTEYLPPVSTLLSQIDQEVGSRAASRLRLGPTGRERLQEVALQLLSSMAAIELNRVDTIAAPISLATSANSRIEEAIAAGYNIAVLRAVYYALTDRSGLDAILAPSPPPGTPAPTPSAALATTVDNIIEYDKYVRVYQGITAQPSIGDVSALLGYALDVQLPPGFTTNYGLYELALSRARLQRIQTGQVQPVVERILQDRYDAVLDDTFESDPLVTAIKRLASLGSDIATPQPSSYPDSPALLAETRGTLETIARLLAPPNYAWLSGQPNAVVAAPVLERLKGVRVVRADFLAGLRAHALQAGTYMRDWLLGATAFDQTAVLASTKEGATLSPGIDAASRLLNELFAQSFMRPAPAVPSGPLPAPGTPVNWDLQSLQQAQGIAESYLAFVPREDQTLPSSVTAAVRSVAGAEAAANIGGFLRLATRPAQSLPNGGARAMLQGVTGLATALPILTNLRNTLRQAGATAEAITLDALVAQQCVTFLRQLYNDLVSAAPYRLANPTLSFWQGSPPLAGPAFGAGSPTDLASTLPTRRDFVETLAQDYASPLVGYLRDPGTMQSGLASGLVAQWQSILNTFDRYHRSDPTNSLTRLELFITVDMDKIDLANCRELTLAGGTGDYFGAQLATIKEAIASRCMRLVHANTSDRYSSLAAIFNAELAGRFPFAASTTAPAAGSSGLALGAADPNAVLGFFLDYGPDLPTLQTRFLSSAYGTNGEAIELFLNQLIAVQAALMPMLADPSGKTPLSYQVNVSFFTNPKAAQAQNQVLDATVDTGSQTASSLNGPSQIVWTNGQPFDVRLRWAANAPLVPDGSRRQPSPSINGLDADFEYGDNWALLRLVEAQAPSAANLNALEDRQPEVVEFDVPLTFNRNAAPGGNAKANIAKVYMRLALRGIMQAPGKPPQTVPITLPPFPTAAPLLGGTVSYLRPPAQAGPIQLAPSLAGTTP